MRNKVLRSLQNAHGDFCVDIFQRADGSFGFEECRRDPEDAGRWTSLQRYGGHVFRSEEEALAEARSRVKWL
ncbi:MAG: hypothetical protein ACT4P3_14140 [Betaproteobacteria bacterium]